MTETDRSDAVRGTPRVSVQRIRRVLGVLALASVVCCAGVVPASAMRIRPLHDRVMAAPALIAATDSQGIVVVLVFTAVVEVDPHGVPHGLMRIDMADGESMLYEPVEALVARDQNQEATELLILVTPRIVKEPADTSMVHVHRDLVDPALLHWIVADPDGNYLMFSTQGVMETLPPAGGPPIRR